MSEQFTTFIENSLKDAWGIFAKSPEVFISIAFGILGSSILLNTLPVLGQLAHLLILAIGPAAIFLAADECSRKGTATFDSLKPLATLFPQLLALVVVKTILVGIGFCLLIIPGIYLSVLLCFAEIFVVVDEKPFLEAMKASKSLVQGHWFRFFGLCLVAGIILFSGALLIGLGLLLTVPFSLILIYCAFRRVKRAGA